MQSIPEDLVFRTYVSTDTTPPVLALPDDITEEATGPDGAVVGFEATATDANPASPQVSCSKNSGDTFPLGTTKVECEATDAAGNKATGSFNVTVQDTTAPTISGIPADKTEEVTGPNGVQVGWTPPTAMDLVDGSVNVGCSPDSGTTFALGESTVTCTATDGHGNSDSKSFKVTVQDTTAPSVSCSVSPSTLRLPANNHKLVTIAATVEVTDGGSSGPAGFTLVSVTSNQADSGLGKDDVPNDIQGWSTGTNDTSGELRAERYRAERVYTLTYQGKDLAGNTKTCQATVRVPKG